jgi:HTH-type transcriptional regulator/antitoxin HigA
MDIKPIHTAADHAAALAEIERLWDAKPGTPDGNDFEVLATLVDAYESKHTPILPPDPIEAIKFRLEQQGLSRKALEPIMGTRARVSEILSGQRKLTLAMIRALNKEFDIPLDVLVAEKTEKAQKAQKAQKTARASRREPALA